ALAGRASPEFGGESPALLLVGDVELELVGDLDAGRLDPVADQLLHLGQAGVGHDLGGQLVVGVGHADLDAVLVLGARLDVHVHEADQRLGTARHHVRGLHAVARVSRAAWDSRRVGARDAARAGYTAGTGGN